MTDRHDQDCHILIMKWFASFHLKLASTVDVSCNLKSSSKQQRGSLLTRLVRITGLNQKFPVVVIVMMLVDFKFKFDY